jgi:hypothetical protein
MTVKFKLTRPKEKDQPAPIRVIITHKGVRTEPATGERIAPKFWNGNRAKLSHSSGEAINTHLDLIEKSLHEFWRGNKSLSGDEFKLGALEIVKGIQDQSTTQKKTVIDAVQQFIAQYEQEKEPGTVKRYRALLSKLTEYGKPVYFETLDHNFYDAFKKFLYGCNNPIYSGFSITRDAADDCYSIVPDGDNGPVGNPVGLFDDVVFKYFINIKTICKWAEKRGFTVHPAYKSWEIIKRDYNPIYLNAEELERLESIPLSKHLDVARDFLVLECRTGQRISDLRRFSKSDIQGDVWTFKQKKGGRTNNSMISLPLVGYCAPALVIIQKYNYELPKISEQRLNEHIKTVCKLAKIDSNVDIYRYQGSKKVRISGPKYEFCSTHIGRKTFITLTLQDPHFTPALVMDLTGIKSYKTLSHYRGKTTIDVARQALESMGGQGRLMKVV